MDKTNNNLSFEIDIFQILRALWKRIWIIAIVGILAAGIGFGYAAFFITPMYSSSVMLYVNNKSVSIGGVAVQMSGADFSVSERLIKTYTVLLNNRTTLNRIIEEAGLPYSYGQLSGMISASAVNETEIMRVTAVANDPYMAATVANAVAEVLPQRVSEIIDGTSVIVIDDAVPNKGKISPDVSKYTITGFAIGILLSAAVIILFTLLDNTIHDEDYIMQTYDYPLLARIPDLLGRDQKSYKKYNYYYYYYQSSHHHHRKSSDQSSRKDDGKAQKKGGEK